MELNLEITCNKCGEKLTAEFLSAYAEINVVPCRTCLRVLRDNYIEAVRNAVEPIGRDVKQMIEDSVDRALTTSKLW